MSANGIKKAASVFGLMQNLRLELGAGDNQDILLMRMFEDANDHMKDRFGKITMMIDADITYHPKGKGAPPKIEACHSSPNLHTDRYE